MKNIFISGLLLSSSIFFSGCGKPFTTQLKKSVQINQEAKNLAEWDSSEFNPEVLFNEWQKKPEKGSKLCESLLSLDGQSLSLFENEIHKNENQKLLLKCKPALLQKLDRYFAEERKKLSVPFDALNPQPTQNKFKFPRNIQKRDYSKGYLAINGDVAPKEVVLTFDDGPSPEYTKAVLQALSEVDAKAHFFELGKNVRVHGEITKLVAKEGHMIGSHTVTHSCIGNLKECGHANGGRQFTFEEATNEIKGGHQAIYDVLGWIDPMFRFPYGAATPELRAFLNQAGVAEFNWSIDSEDWKAQTNEVLLQNILVKLEARGRGLILLHDIQRKTAEILPQLLNELYTRGYSIVQLQPMDPTARYNSKLVSKPLP